MVGLLRLKEPVANRGLGHPEVLTDLRESQASTCYFHSNMAHDNTVVHPGSTDPGYDDSWQTADVVAADHCQGCHQADPRLHSPWIDQLQDPDDSRWPLLPVTAASDAPYTVVGEGFSQPIHAGAPDNSCTSCHRPQCDTHLAVPLGALLMPGSFADSTVTTDGAADLQAVREWCRDLPTGGGEGGEDGGEECEVALDCAFTCGTDEACALECGEAAIDGDRKAAFEALVTCVAEAGCGFKRRTSTRRARPSFGCSTRSAPELGARPWRSGRGESLPRACHALERRECLPVGPR